MATTTDPVDVALGAAAVGLRVGGAAGQAALDTARVVGRITLIGRPVGAVAARTADEGRRARVQVGEIVDGWTRQLVERGDIERIVGDAMEHPATKRLVESVLTSPAFERLLFEILDSQLLLEATDRVLNSPEMQRAIERIASSPELRRAMAEQSSGMAKEVVGGVRNRSARIDDVAEQKVRGWLRRQKPQTTS
jgi:hypothetical protein